VEQEDHACEDRSRLDVSICFPTAGRPAYLEVALASVAPQARAQGAEILVVHDAREDAAMRAVAARHGARYVAHGAARGINAARNTCLDEARGDLVALLDDDIEAWPGWLAALLAADPQADVLGGPIRPRLEGSRLRLCGREPVAITALESDIGFAWGANLALRRSALVRAGRFDASMSQIGDEEDWQRRLRAAGGRIAFVAQAGVDHRRAGADASLRSLVRANWHRGRQARRYDVHKGTAPGLAAELRVLAGCVWHRYRRGCDNGWLLAALSAGRVAEWARPVRPAWGPDYLSGESGTLSRKGRLRGALLDRVADLAGMPQRLSLLRAARRSPPRKVLVLSIARPEHAGAAAAAGRALEHSRHTVDVRLSPPQPGAGKWANLNAALERDPAAGYDWLLLVDDDVVLPYGFLDAFLAACERLGFALAQPAHAHASHAAWRVTRRRPGVLARRTRFVEIGPVTAVHRDAFEALLPFPDLQMGWGLDGHWAAVAQEHGWPVGIVDATPVRHTRPVAASYPREDAIAEAQEFLRDRAYVGREAAQETLATWRRLPPAAADRGGGA
jgi:GT2 family glycosyltransferase